MQLARQIANLRERWVAVVRFVRAELAGPRAAIADKMRPEKRDVSARHAGRSADERRKQLVQVELLGVQSWTNVLRRDLQLTRTACLTCGT